MYGVLFDESGKFLRDGTTINKRMAARFKVESDEMPGDCAPALRDCSFLYERIEIWPDIEAR